MHIIGAGMAGLLAGAMLRHEATAIHEAQAQIPNNHSAVLRFRSTVVGDVIGVPFKRVTAVKASHPWQNPIADAMAYSAKTNGSHSLRSIMSADGKSSERFIAPADLISQLVERVQCPIHCSDPVDPTTLESHAPAISTIPMPLMMQMLGWDRQSDFQYRRGLNIKSTVPGANAYCSLYVPDPLLPFSRISLTGDELIVECNEEFLDDVNNTPANNKAHMIREAFLKAVHMMGLDGVEISYEAYEQKYAKILPIDENERRAFILWASTQHNVYSLGRFATWRPGMLLDDVVNDVRVIQRLIKQRGASYYHHLKD